MDVVTQEALARLRSALANLLPAPDDPDLAPTITVLPVRVTPTGLGGFVGVNDIPQGSIVGRRIEASAELIVRGTDEGALSVNVASVTDALVGADRAALVQQGIYRLQLEELGDVGSEGEGNDAVARRNASFGVLYEFLKLPEAGEGVIQEIPLELDLSDGGSNPRLLIDQTFEDASSLELFEVVDDPQATTGAPSLWEHDAAEARIEQHSGIRGGGLTATPLKAGTYLVLIPNSAHPEVRDFLFRTRLETSDVDGIGCVFRYRDVDNFYYFVMSNRNDYYLLGKKVGGVFAALDSGGLLEDGGPEVDTEFELKLTAVGATFRVYLDDALVVDGQDTSLDGAGRVGFMCHGNDGASFYRLKLVQFQE
jgi:hypothetical protein